MNAPTYAETLASLKTQAEETIYSLDKQINDFRKILDEEIKEAFRKIPTGQKTGTSVLGQFLAEDCGLCYYDKDGKTSITFSADGIRLLRLALATSTETTKRSSTISIGDVQITDSVGLTYVIDGVSLESLTAPLTDLVLKRTSFETRLATFFPAEKTE